MTIKPWLTAIKRKKISKPMEYLVDNNFILKKHNILDYGCGYGFDIYELDNLGFNITGYDKYILPYKNNSNIYNKKFDIITSHYMFNVIPSLEERSSTLKNMVSLLNKNGSIFITVRNNKEFKRINKNSISSYNDGIVTKKNTFQKYFSNDEIISFISSTVKNAIITTIKDNDYLLIQIQLKED